MPKGTPKDWTLDELNLIWEFDGDDGSTVLQMADNLGISNGTWYSMKARLRAEGGPEALFAVLQDSKTRRYNRGGDKRATSGRVGGENETLTDALSKTIQITAQNAGRGGAYTQYRATIPRTIAEPFIRAYGDYVRFQVTEDGILLVPVPKPEIPTSFPSWIEADSE